MVHRNLEAPGTQGQPDWAALYRALGDDIPAARPIFTGDVFEVAESGNNAPAVLVLQHPCALRTNGVDLVRRLLTAEVHPSPSIPFSEWKGRYKQMPLPALKSGDHFVARLNEPGLIESASLDLGTRIATMSQLGVNLLLQRWVHHNSRVIVPTFEFQAVTEAQYEEADLVEYWCEDLAATETDIPVESAAAHAWLRSSSSTEGRSWQDLLEDAQTRGVVRVAMRKRIREIQATR